jgi:hypothetical protein
LDALADELNATPLQRIRAKTNLDTRQVALISRIDSAVNVEFRRWAGAIDQIIDQIPEENQALRGEIEGRELQAFRTEVQRLTEQVFENNPSFNNAQVAKEVQRQMGEWITENQKRLNDRERVDAPINVAASAQFIMPSLSQPPAAPPGDEFTEEGQFKGLFGGRLANRVGDYFEETTAQDRERYAREKVQPVIQEELKDADEAVRRITEGYTARVTGTGGIRRVAPQPLDQQGIPARRYRSAVLFTGVSIEDLERGSFENGVTIVDDLRNPNMTPFFPNKKALEDALDEYDNATPEAQSETLIGRLITELGAENTGTADQFATIQGLLLQRRGMN